MFIDEAIGMPGDLPPDLREDWELLGQYWREGREMDYLMLEEPACASIKQALLDGRIGTETARLLFRRHGWGLPDD